MEEAVSEINSQTASLDDKYDWQMELLHLLHDTKV
jgi:hypothetical protein